MELFEVINKILEQQKMSKREFAQKLIALQPKSNRTGEVISENIIYSYLSGATAIKAYLIPYIADVLGVAEQFLFEENEKIRLRIIKHISKELSNEEKEYLKEIVCRDFDEYRDKKEFSDIVNLLEYAPNSFLIKLKSSLSEFKKISDKMNF